VNNDWGAGYCGTLRLANTDSTVMTWDVTVTIEGTLTNLWNGEWGQTGNLLNVRGVSWNSQLQPGEINTSVGFCAER